MSSDSSPGRSPVNILFVGDTPDEIDTISRLIHAESLDCFATDNEREANDWVKAQRPSIVVVSYWEIALAEKFIRKLTRTQGTKDPANPLHIMVLHRSLHNQRAYELYRSGLIHAAYVTRPLTDAFGLRMALLQLIAKVQMTVSIAESERLMDQFRSHARDLAHVISTSLAEARTLADESLNGTRVAAWLDGWAPHVTTLLEGLLAIENADALAQSAALVMLVEDEPTYRAILRTMLESGGFRVIEAQDGQEALEHLKVARPNLIILDYLLPGIDGLETLKQIKAHPMLGSIPVMMLSGMSDKDLVRESIRQGAVDFLVKPSNRNTLMSKVQTHIR